MANSRRTFERSKVRKHPRGNVWVDIQQMFYRMEENVSGCYAQKPLKVIDRIVKASSDSGTMLLSISFRTPAQHFSLSEINHRRCMTMDIDPLFCEITIRRLEHFRRTGRVGWQNGHPFEDEYVCPQVEATEPAEH